MAYLYTEKDILKTLKELRIAPENGKVDGAEAAKILSWRAKQEHDVNYQYDATAIRQHMKKGHFPEGAVTKASRRSNLYQVDIIFKLPISPRRGAARRKDLQVS